MEERRRILVADDEADIRELLRLYLENDGYLVIEAADGAEALSLIQEGAADLVLLDIMMPHLDGYQVLKRMRRDSAIPVIVISAKGEDPEKIIGLDLGADDYLVKPFNPLEALARVRSSLRRAYGSLATRPDEPAPPAREAVSPQVLEVRDLRLDLESCVLERAGARIDLTPVEFRIMSMLMARPGRVFTKQQIYEHGWEDVYVASDNNVMVCMSKLRSKLASDPGAYIATVRGLGYRLEA